MSLATEIEKKLVNRNQIALFWLGQAGFVIKCNHGRTITIDPYLTDCCEYIAGLKRLSPKLISPEKLKTDILFSSHNHPDHFDLDAVPIIMANGETMFIGSQTTVQSCLEMGIPNSLLTGLNIGDTVDLDWVRFTAVYADHGVLAPDAIGVLIYIDGITIYFTGDTSYQPEKMQTAMAAKPDIILLPINGEFGNLNAEEAAMLVFDTQAKVAIACHFWTFVEHGGEPKSFKEEMKSIAPKCQAIFLRQGESFVFQNEQT